VVRAYHLGAVGPGATGGLERTVRAAAIHPDRAHHRAARRSEGILRAAARRLRAAPQCPVATLGDGCIKAILHRGTEVLLANRRRPQLVGHGGLGPHFNGPAPLPTSSGEGGGQPVPHRYNPAGNRRVSAALHRMAITQLRCEPRASQLYTNARNAGHTNKEAMRILKRHLSNVVHRQMLRDLQTGASPSPTDIGASSALDAASATSTTTGSACCCTAAAATGKINPLRASEGAVHGQLRRAAYSSGGGSGARARGVPLGRECQARVPR